MGRPGAGGGSSIRHSSSGGHRISHSSGGHRIGSSSSRPKTGSSSSRMSSSSSRPSSSLMSTSSLLKSSSDILKSNDSKPKRAESNPINNSSYTGGNTMERTTGGFSQPSQRPQVERPQMERSITPPPPPRPPRQVVQHTTYNVYVDQENRRSTTRRTGDSYTGGARNVSSNDYDNSSTTSSGTTVGIIVAIIVTFTVALIAVVAMIALSKSSGSTSTVVREKLDSHYAYMNDCVIDEVGWVDSTIAVSKGLKKFWEDTGVQPYVILKAYDPTLVYDEDKEDWASSYYEQNFAAENIFLYVYFAEEDADNEMGYMTYTNGYEASTIMDAEAVNIFWNYVDRNWASDKTMDNVIIDMFNQTANAIMHVSTTGKDIAKWFIVLLVITVVSAVTIIVLCMKHQRAREKSEEDARILNTPIGDLAKTSAEEKYGD